MKTEYFLISLIFLQSLYSFHNPLKKEIQRDTIIFKDGYEAGQDSTGNFINWDETPLYGGAGTANAIDDTLIHYEGNHSARFELTDGTIGGWAYTSKIIPWPNNKRLWYSCCLRNGPVSHSNVIIGGLYFMEAYIIHPSGYRERANIETHPYQGLPDSLFMIRMAYRGRDGERHRQHENLQFIKRGEWYHITMLVDLSGENPLYAWWLNGELIWYEYDTTSGTDTLAPTEFHVGACWLDWYEGNKALVWIDGCQVADYGSSINIDENNKVKRSKLLFLPTLYTKKFITQNPIEKDINFILYDILGRKSSRIDFKNLNSGIYIIEFNFKNFNTFKKIIYLK
ncbi:MAG: T9SS type A sorting domain-containing protein [candidate division WOR-3 bacterium]